MEATGEAKIVARNKMKSGTGGSLAFRGKDLFLRDGGRFIASENNPAGSGVGRIGLHSMQLIKSHCSPRDSNPLPPRSLLLVLFQMSLGCWCGAPGFWPRHPRMVRETRTFAPAPRDYVSNFSLDNTGFILFLSRRGGMPMAVNWP